MMKYILKPNDSSLAVSVACMKASDGLPFRVFGTSTDMLSLFAAAEFTGLPKSANGTKTLVSNHGQLVSLVMAELAERKPKGQKFSITFDEWTSAHNLRCMIVNVHEQGQKY